MKKNTKVLIGVLGFSAIGYFLYKFVFKPTTKNKTKNEDITNQFPIYENPLCSDGIDGGCDIVDPLVKNVQLFLNTPEGGDAQIAEDGKFGSDTATAINNYLDSVDGTEYSTLGYNLVETPNYITLALYNSI